MLLGSPLGMLKGAPRCRSRRTSQLRRAGGGPIHPRNNVMAGRLGQPGDPVIAAAGRDRNGQTAPPTAAWASHHRRASAAPHRAGSGAPRSSAGPARAPAAEAWHPRPGRGDAVAPRAARSSRLQQGRPSDPASATSRMAEQRGDRTRSGAAPPGSAPTGSNAVAAMASHERHGRPRPASTPRFPPAVRSAAISAPRPLLRSESTRAFPLPRHPNHSRLGNREGGGRSTSVRPDPQRQAAPWPRFMAIRRPRDHRECRGDAGTTGRSQRIRLAPGHASPDRPYRPNRRGKIRDRPSVAGNPGDSRPTTRHKRGAVAE